MLKRKEQSGEIYLSIVGHVFDVTPGAKFYDKNGSYSFFAYKDGSRAYATGRFGDEKEIVADVSDFKPVQCLAVHNWLQFFVNHQTYKQVGYMIGYYFSERGDETEEMKKFKNCVEEGNKVKQIDDDEKAKKECNFQWDIPAKKKKYWCKSNDLVPRKAIFMENAKTGAVKEICTCIAVHDIDKRKDLLQYSACPPFDRECIENVS